MLFIEFWLCRIFWEGNKAITGGEHTLFTISDDFYKPKEKVFDFSIYGGLLNSLGDI